MATFDQFIASLRQEFGEPGAGKKFEVFCKWFLENDPEWSKNIYYRDIYTYINCSRVAQRHTNDGWAFVTPNDPALHRSG